MPTPFAGRDTPSTLLMRLGQDLCCQEASLHAPWVVQCLAIWVAQTQSPSGPRLTAIFVGSVLSVERSNPSVRVRTILQVTVLIAPNCGVQCSQPAGHWLLPALAATAHVATRVAHHGCTPHTPCRVQAMDAGAASADPGCTHRRDERAVGARGPLHRFAGGRRVVPVVACQLSRRGGAQSYVLPR